MSVAPAPVEKMRAVPEPSPRWKRLRLIVMSWTSSSIRIVSRCMTRSGPQTAPVPEMNGWKSTFSTSTSRAAVTVNGSPFPLPQTRLVVLAGVPKSPSR